MLKICKQPPKRYNVGAPSQLTINLSNSSGIDQVDAERRRYYLFSSIQHPKFIHLLPFVMFATNQTQTKSTQSTQFTHEQNRR